MKRKGIVVGKDMEALFGRNSINMLASSVIKESSSEDNEEEDSQISRSNLSKNNI
jgi:hypothetical protein